MNSSYKLLLDKVAAQLADSLKEAVVAKLAKTAQKYADLAVGAVTIQSNIIINKYENTKHTISINWSQLDVLLHNANKFRILDGKSKKCLSSHSYCFPRRLAKI
jgi:hypothetical protein